MLPTPAIRRIDVLAAGELPHRPRPPLWWRVLRQPQGSVGTILVGLLVSPHTYRYDFAMLAIVSLLATHPAVRYVGHYEGTPPQAPLSVRSANRSGLNEGPRPGPARMER